MTTSRIDESRPFAFLHQTPEHPEAVAARVAATRARFSRPSTVAEVLSEPDGLQEDDEDDELQEAWSPAARAAALARRRARALLRQRQHQRPDHRGTSRWAGTAGHADELSANAHRLSALLRHSSTAKDYRHAGKAHRDAAYALNDFADKMETRMGDNITSGQQRTVNIRRAEARAHLAAVAAHEAKAEAVEAAEKENNPDLPDDDSVKLESFDVPPATASLQQRIQRFTAGSSFTASTPVDVGEREEAVTDDAIQEDLSPISLAALEASKKANAMYAADPSLAEVHVTAAQAHMQAGEEATDIAVKSAHRRSADAHMASANTAREPSDAGSDYDAAAAHAVAKDAWNTAGGGKFGLAREMAELHTKLERRHGRGAAGKAGDDQDGAQESLDGVPAPDASLAVRLKRFTNQR